MSKEIIKIEILQSKFDPKYFALNIDDTRYGVDAGPWEIVGIAAVPKDEMQKLIDKVAV